jgi:hypothetical protein
MSEWVGHILVAKIVIAAMVTMMRQNTYVVCKICFEAEEIVPMVAVFGRVGREVYSGL